MKETRPGALIGVKASSAASGLIADAETGGLVALRQSKGVNSLPADAADKALRRLGWIALFVAISLFADVIGHVILDRADFAMPVPMTDLTIVARLVGAVFGAVTFLVVRFSKIPRGRKLLLGLAFEVIGAGSIAITEMALVTAPGSVVPLGVLSYVSLWIIIFRLIVPTASLPAAITAVLSAAMVPLAIEVVNYQAGGEAIDSFVRGMLTQTTMVNAWLAWLVGRSIFQLSREVGAAQELGAYRLESRLGAGGMGEVWRASHRMLRRPAAIKLIRPEVLGARDTDRYTATLKRFEQEALATANLASVHSVQLFDFGATEDGSFYYVMELLDGIDMETMVEKYGPVEPERVVHFLKQACHSLEDAHEKGLIHRDIKPANLFVCRLGPDYDFVKVLDFGLVKTAGQDDLKLTTEGITTGTPAYMAPEMALGKKDIKAPTDLYMLGCVAYWLLTGGLVFEGDNAITIVSSHIHETPVNVAERSELDIPEELASLVMSCLQKSPEERPQSARALRRQLESLTIDAWSAERAQTWWKRHRPQAGGPSSVATPLSPVH